MPDGAPTYLYRFFDRNDRLLYVGISTSVLTRMDTHRHESRWFVDATRIEFQVFPTRQDALDAERTAIHAEQPMHNGYASRRRVMLTIEIDPELKARIERCRSAQPFRPSMTQMVNRALREFLDQQKGKAR